jgi:hypothetical protein
MNRIIPFSAAQAGMILGEAATVDQQVLLAPGTRLTAANLVLLGARGVRSLSVMVPAEQRTPVDTRLVLALDRSLRPRFARNDLAHPAMKELYRLALLRRIQQAAAQIHGARRER